MPDICSVDSNLEPMGSHHEGNPYLFTLTTNNEVYYCGEPNDFDENGSIIASNPCSGKGTRIAIVWAEDIKSAYLSEAATHLDNVMMQQPIKEPPEETKEEKQPKVNRFNYQTFLFRIIISLK